MNNNFAACVQNVRHQHTYTISDCRATGQSLLQVTNVTNLCFVHALLHNTSNPNFIIYKSISMKLFDTFASIFFGNIPL